MGALCLSSSLYETTGNCAANESPPYEGQAQGPGPASPHPPVPTGGSKHSLDSPIRLSKFIRMLGRKRPFHFPIRSVKFIKTGGGVCGDSAIRLSKVIGSL